MPTQVLLIGIEPEVEERMGVMVDDEMAFTGAAGLAGAVVALESGTVDVVICGPNMPGTTASDLLEDVRSVAPGTPVLNLTGVADARRLIELARRMVNNSEHGCKSSDRLRRELFDLSTRVWNGSLDAPDAEWSSSELVDLARAIIAMRAS